MNKLAKKKQKQSSAGHLKQKPSSYRSGDKVGLLRFSRIHLFVVAGVVAVIGGVYAVYQSFAYESGGREWSNFTVDVRNVSGWGVIPGATVNISSVYDDGSSAGYTCAPIPGYGDISKVGPGGHSVATSSNGTAIFTCVVKAKSGKRIGYRVDSISAPGWNKYNTGAPGSDHVDQWVKKGVTYRFIENGTILHPTNGQFYISFMQQPPQPQPPAIQPQPPVIQPQAPAPQPQPGPSGSSNTSAPSRVTPRPRPAPSSSSNDSSDSNPPSAPAGLTATEGARGTIVLSWQPSTDNKAVTGYMVERSTDGQNWTVLNEDVTTQTFTDSDASFGTKYSYRVSAKDEAGNGSDYAVVDISTSAFEANAFTDKESIIENEDKSVSVKIPEGALPENAVCKIDTTSEAAIPDGQSLVAGAYALVCKKKDGSVIEQYNKPIEFTVKTTESDKARLMFQDGDNWEDSGESYNQEVQGYKFSTDHPKSFAVLTTNKKGTNWLLLIFGIFLLLMVILGIILWIIRRRQNQQAEDGESYGLDYFDSYPQEQGQVQQDISQNALPTDNYQYPSAQDGQFQGVEPEFSASTQQYQEVAPVNSEPIGVELPGAQAPVEPALLETPPQLPAEEKPVAQAKPPQAPPPAPLPGDSYPSSHDAIQPR